MKVLYISGSDDYHYVTFEQQKEFSIDEIVQKCNESEDKTAMIELEDGDYFKAELFEFGDVDAKFLDFLISKKDYEASKHSDWLIIQ